MPATVALSFTSSQLKLGLTVMHNQQTAFVVIIAATVYSNDKVRSETIPLSSEFNMQSTVVDGAALRIPQEHPTGFWIQAEGSPSPSVFRH